MDWMMRSRNSTSSSKVRSSWPIAAQSILRSVRRSAVLHAIGNPPDYEPPPDPTVAAIAEARGEDPPATLCDLMLDGDAAAMLMMQFFNHAEGNHDAIYDMISHPAAVSGLSDGGAHCELICDGSPSRAAIVTGTPGAQANARHRNAFRAE